MKKNRHTVEQIIKILRQLDEGCEIEAVCREHNIGKATFHRWRRKYGKMEMKDAKRLKELEKENTELTEEDRGRSNAQHPGAGGGKRKKVVSPEEKAAKAGPVHRQDPNHRKASQPCLELGFCSGPNR